MRGGRIPLNREPCRLAVLLDGAAAATRARAAHHQVAIEVQSPDVIVHVDAMRVRQAIDNLVDNSLRHAHPGATITITACTESDSLRITVQDHGAGFRSLEQVQALISRADGESLPGDGLGLRIASAVATSHAGVLRVADARSRGARVTLTLGHVR